MISPAGLLILVCLITASAWLVQTCVDRRRRRQLADLARQWGMNYSMHDVFNLAEQAASRLPLIGAADVRVRDLIYGKDNEAYHYIFRVEYSGGVIGFRSRRSCVASAFEPARPPADHAWTDFRVAPDGLPLLEQYKSLKNW